MQAVSNVPPLHSKSLEYGRTPFQRAPSSAPLHAQTPYAPFGLDTVPTGGTASLVSCIVNLAKTILGAGILTLPGGFKGAGLLWGTIFTVVTAVIGVFSLGLLGEMSQHFDGPQPSLAAIGYRAAGVRGKRLVDIILVGNNSGAMTSYLVIASTTMTNLVGSAVLPRQAFVLLSIVLISPLCLVREVKTLRFTSTIALCAISLLVVMIVLFAIPGLLFQVSTLHFFQFFWITVYCVHCNTFLILCEGLFQPCGTYTNGTIMDCRGDVYMAKAPLSVLTQFVIFTNAYVSVVPQPNFDLHGKT